jgi:predicted DCC family thiol-disulfide oxidoreductase YuxK
MKPSDASRYPRSESLVALYDGLCLICRGSRAFIMRLDRGGRVAFADVRDPAVVARHAPAIAQEALLGEMHVLAEGRVLSGFHAVRRLLRAVPLAWPLWALLSLPGMNWLGPRLYRAVARRRFLINRLLGRELPPVDCAGACQPMGKTSTEIRRIP